MKRAFIVSGPPSSGNRVLTAFLVQAGCSGFGATGQPADEEIDLEATNPVIIRHGSGLRNTIRTFSRAGYSVHVIVVLREPHALVSSQVRTGHYPTRKSAIEGLPIEYLSIFGTLEATQTPFHIVPYEALVLHPLPVMENLLLELALPTSNLGQELEVNNAGCSCILYDANARHYIDLPEPTHRIAYGSELIWYPTRGFGYFPVQDHLAPYTDAYFAKYVGYTGSTISDRITEARLQLVHQFIAPEDELLDFGVGSGTFIVARGGHTKGFDVMPAAKRWLLETGMFHDPYATPAPAISFWDALEHVPDPAGIINRVLKWVFVSMPIYRDPKHVLESKHYRPDEHYWYFTRKGLIDWFDQLGFVCRGISGMEMLAGREDIESFVFERKPNNEAAVPKRPACTQPQPVQPSVAERQEQSVAGHPQCSEPSD